MPAAKIWLHAKRLLGAQAEVLKSRRVREDNLAYPLS